MQARSWPLAVVDGEAIEEPADDVVGVREVVIDRRHRGQLRPCAGAARVPAPPARASPPPSPTDTPAAPRNARLVVPDRMPDASSGLVGGPGLNRKRVTPGIATGAAAGRRPKRTGTGRESSLEFIAISQVISWPVYAAMRPMIASRVLLAMYSPLLIGLPLRMLANSSSCSVWIHLVLGPS